LNPTDYSAFPLLGGVVRDYLGTTKFGESI
jgi:hypothetical protein